MYQPRGDLQDFEPEDTEERTISLLGIQRETQDSKTFAKTANSDQDLNMARHALDES